MGFEGNGEDVIKSVHALLIVELLQMLTANVGHSVELVSDLCQGFIAKEVLLLAVEVDAHEVHLQ